MSHSDIFKYSFKVLLPHKTVTHSVANDGNLLLCVVANINVAIENVVQFLCVLFL